MTSDPARRISRRAFLAGAIGAAAVPVRSGAVARTRSIPRPVAMVRTRWSTDPWSLGSYSLLPPGATPEHRRALTRVIDDRLLLAGEATSVEAPATVHGALASGRRAAAQVQAIAGSTDERVVVVGAGAAGVQCASELRRSGFAVTVLEARDRIGGRIDTRRIADWPIPVEGGASWVHDTPADGLAPALSRLGIGTVPFDYEQAIVDGRRVLTGERADAFLAPAERLVERAVAWADARDRDVSLAAARHAVDPRGSSVGASTLRLFDRTELASEYGAGPDGLSATWALEEGHDGDDLLVVGGYGRLVESLADGLDVRTGAAVLAIDRDRRGVRVHLDGASTPIVADRVVVTAPLAVLQAGRIRFTPALPRSTNDALARLGTGVLEKVWLRWDRPWWSRPERQWTTTADQTFPEWVNLAAFGHPVLLGLVGGARARAIAPWSDEQVLQRAVADLQTFATAGF